MIKIVRTKPKKGIWVFEIDGEIVNPDVGGVRRYDIQKDYRNAVSLYIYDVSIVEKLLESRPNELLGFGAFAWNFNNPYPLETFKTAPVKQVIGHMRDQMVIATQTKRGKQKKFKCCAFLSTLDVLNWTKPYPFNTYINHVLSELRKNRPEFIDPEGKEWPSTYGLFNFVLRENVVIKKQIEEFSNILQTTNNYVVNALEAEFSVISFREFQLPPEVRVPCEQYLMYFADFLRELGILADANIQHDNAGKTLFSVELTDKKVALSSIREALDLYLELPSSPLAEEVSSDTRLLFLQSEINSLKMRLSHAQIRQIELNERFELQRQLLNAKTELLDVKKQEIDRIRQIQPTQYLPSIVSESALEQNYIEGEIVEDTTVNTKPISNKEIDLGLITLKPAKIAVGIEANTPRLFRLGIKTGKQLFDYLDSKLNSESDDKSKNRLT